MLAVWRGAGMVNCIIFNGTESTKILKKLEMCQYDTDAPAILPRTQAFCKK